MATLTIDFGGLEPDWPNFRNPGVLLARGVVPRTDSYGPFKGLKAFSNALSARALGGVSARDASLNSYTYAGDTSKLYEMVGSVFTDESKVGGYSTASDDVWEFAVWGVNNKVIATNYTDPVQSITIGGGASGAFADMITSTSKPKAKHVGIIGRFVVLGFTNDTSDGERPSRVWWGGIGDETDFDPAAATQCDYEDLPTGGEVQRIVGGSDYGLVFQKQMVRTMRYIGPGPIFDIQPLNYAPGTPIPSSVIAYKGNVFYISEDGFMALRGTQVEHIGTDKIDRFFWDQFDINNRRYVSAAIDPVNKVVAWAFPGAGASSLPNIILMCKYDQNKWSDAVSQTEILLQTETQGYTLDGLDALGTNIDDASVFDESLDSEKWKGGSIKFGAFDHSHKLGLFTGPSVACGIDTGDIQPVPGRRWQINSVRPVVERDPAYLYSTTAGVKISKRQRLSDAVGAYSINASIMNSNGVCKVRSSGQYQRIRFSVGGGSAHGLEHIRGLEIDYTLLGNR